MIALVLIIIIIAAPFVCFGLFLYSLLELIADKRIIKNTGEGDNPDGIEKTIIKINGLNEDIQKQMIRMIVTGILGGIFISIDVSIIIHICRIVSGEISIM